MTTDHADKPGDDFKASATLATSAQRLAALRTKLARRGIDGLIVPHTDEFQNEEIPPSAARLKWLTGFSGSDGGAAVLSDRAVAMSDGRYFAQIRREVDATLFEIEDSVAVSPEKWLAAHAPRGARIGYDPALHTEADVKMLQKIFHEKGLVPVALDSNPVDALWTDRPPPPASAVSLFPEDIAGRSAAEKRAEAAAAVAHAEGEAVILATPDSIAWMLNIRADDVPHVPVALSRLILRGNGAADWFIDPARVPDNVRAYLGEDVRLRLPSELSLALADLAGDAKASGRPILLDPKTAPYQFRQILESAGARVEALDDPTRDGRIHKTLSELQSVTDVHVRDGLAMVRFLKWLEEEAPKGQLTEISVAQRLEAFRRMDPDYLDSSFDTIVGWRGNGADPHYTATEKTNAAITGSGILLVDSGAHYPGGTTDVTRTVVVGDHTRKQRHNSTLALMGLIDASGGLFNTFMSGSALDDRARRWLLEERLDFDHGTGHDVDTRISVHGADVTLAQSTGRYVTAGELMSIEPGVYFPDEYGIRHENLAYVLEDGFRRGTENSAHPEKILRFETVTLVPFDKRLIDVEMLNDRQRQWLDEYHERVYRTLAPLLEPPDATWLRQVTHPLEKAAEPGLRPGPARYPPAPAL